MIDHAADGEDVEQAQVQVGGHEAGRPGNGRPGQQRTQQHQDRREHEQALVRLGGDDVLLAEDLQHVGHGLRPAVPAAGAHGAVAALQEAGDLALHPGEDDGAQGHDDEHERGHDRRGGDVHRRVRHAAVARECS